MSSPLDTRLDRRREGERPALLLGEAPGMIAEIAAAVAHAAEANSRDIEAGAAELGVFHRLSEPVRVSCEVRRDVRREELMCLGHLPLPPVLSGRDQASATPSIAIPHPLTGADARRLQCECANCVIMYSVHPAPSTAAHNFACVLSDKRHSGKRGEVVARSLTHPVK